MVEGIHREADRTLHLPRILCLHGGGTNARIFHAQCRALRARLQTKFRFCFVDAPFICQTSGPDVTRVYKHLGPFRRWLRWEPGHPEIDDRIAVKAIEAHLEAAIKEDDRRGATGEWVGLLGFSQGAKMCASLLLRQQVRTDKGFSKQDVGSNYRFAVLLAGRAPLVSLDTDLIDSPRLCHASQLGGTEFPFHGLIRDEHLLRLPTLHVHGLRDPGLELHRQMLDEYCEEESARLVEWDGDHRVPIKSHDVTLLVDRILCIARETGVLIE